MPLKERPAIPRLRFNVVLHIAHRSRLRRIADALKKRLEALQKSLAARARPNPLIDQPQHHIQLHRRLRRYLLHLVAQRSRSPRSPDSSSESPAPLRPVLRTRHLVQTFAQHPQQKQPLPQRTPTVLNHRNHQLPNLPEVTRSAYGSSPCPRRQPRKLVCSKVTRR